jgi:hypothetical protein
MLWIFFTAKGLVKEKDKSTFREYVNLALADPEGRRAIVFGKDFYEFLRFCKSNLPEMSGFEIEGVAGDSTDLPRMAYYLYPALKCSPAEFILVYKTPGFVKEGTVLYSSLDEESFILKYR